MPLTQEEQKAADSAELEDLVADLMAALRGSDNVKKGDALTALTDFRARTLFPDLRERAADARAAGASAVISDGLKQLAEISGRLGPLAEVFSDAARIAVTGKKDLLFPRLSASANTMLQVVDELQKAADKVRSQLANVHELGDVPDALSKVKVALETLKTRVKALQV